MANFRVDQYEPFYANADTSTNFVGKQLTLYGVFGISIQVVAANGSAGTVYIDGTNQEGVSPTYAQIANVVVVANGSALINYSVSDPVTCMRAMRVRYTASSAGNVTISINLRRLAS